jgi:predicted small metal-binding protein
MAFQKRRKSTMASFKCKDMGIGKCDFKVKDGNQAELVRIITLHAETTHNMKTPLPPDMMEKVNKAIKK